MGLCGATDNVTEEVSEALPTTEYPIAHRPFDLLYFVMPGTGALQIEKETNFGACGLGSSLQSETLRILCCKEGVWHQLFFTLSFTSTM